MFNGQTCMFTPEPLIAAKLTTLAAINHIVTTEVPTELNPTPWPHPIANWVNVMPATAVTPEQLMCQQQNLLAALWLAQKSFAEAFMAAQQLIEEQHQQIMQWHLLLEERTQNILDFIQQCHNNRSLHISPPLEPTPLTASIYLHAKTYRYFLAVHCTPAAPSGHWQHRIWWTHQQHLLHSTWTTSMYRTQRIKEPPTISPIIQLGLDTQPTAPTKPLYDNIISMPGMRLDVMSKFPLLPVPITSYCPPWPLPHRKYWYYTNVDLTQLMSQYKFHMKPPDTPQYYQFYHMQHGEGTYSPTSQTQEPSTNEKNLLWPP